MYTKDLSQGDEVTLINFGKTDIIYRRRLLALGINYGTIIKVIRKAPFGCPIQIAVKNTTITLRQNEASQLIWKYIND